MPRLNSPLVFFFSAALPIATLRDQLASIKGHDAFLTEWEQLTHILSEALSDGIARAARRGLHAVEGGRAGAA